MECPPNYAIRPDSPVPVQDSADFVAFVVAIATSTTHLRHREHRVQRGFLVLFVSLWLKFQVIKVSFFYADYNGSFKFQDAILHTLIKNPGSPPSAIVCRRAVGSVTATPAR